MRRILSILCSVLMLFLLVTPAQAQDVIESSYISVPISDTEVWIFPTKEDYNAYLKDVNPNPESDGISLMYSTEHEISRETIYHRFLNYHPLTPYWTKSSSYTVSAGTQVSGSTTVVYDGISYTLNAARTDQVSITIPANSQKYSKLAFSADFLVKRMVTYYHDNNGVYDQYKYVSYSVLNTYLDVTYQW